MCLAAIIAANLNPDGIDNLQLRGSLGSLHQVIEMNYAVNEKPEFFCFGLLKDFDIAKLVAMIAPRRVRLIEPTERAKRELADLKSWYGAYGSDFDPLR